MYNITEQKEAVMSHNRAYLVIAGATSSSPYIYGYGLDSYIRFRTGAPISSPYYSNYINYNNIHTSPDDNKYR